MRTYEKTHPPTLETTDGIYYTGTPYPTYNKKNDVTLSKNQAHELLTVIEPNAPEPSLTQLLQTICPEIPPTDLITNQNIQRALGRMTALNHIKEKYSKDHSIQLTRNKFQWTCTIYADGDKKHTLTLDDTTTGRINANQDTIETIFNDTNTLSQLKQITMPDKIMEAISEFTTESQIMDALQTPDPSNTSSTVLEHLLSDAHKQGITLACIKTLFRRNSNHPAMHKK